MGPLLFNVALHDLFVIMNPHDVANYADNNTPYVSGKNIHEIVKSLEEASRRIFKWFSDNQLEENASICHLLLSTYQEVHVSLGIARIKNGQYEKLLGVTVDTKLSLKTYPADMGKSKNKLKGFR